MNPLFQSFQQKQASNPQNMFTNALQNLAMQVQQMGLTPEQLVRQKIQNGEMTEAQFRQYSQIADQLTGRNR